MATAPVASVIDLPMDPAAALHQLYGFADFRPGQREAVEAALDGRDVLIVMPTGAGKSLCYQLPALMRDDLTIVVSPLVSLMQDQVEGLARVAPGAVGLVNAQRSAAENQATVARAIRGEHKILYIAPERFSSPAFLQQIQGARVGLFVVDEAHCVSQWGHDFRPDYFRLADAARWLGASAIVASTATATPQVAADIAARLGLQDPVKVSTGFDRPNLSFVVAPCKTRADKERRLVAALSEPGALPAIVYAGTRARTAELAERLSGALACEVLPYHAGLARDVRAETQRRFMDGRVDVVVATNAFGMGVDKADVRTVAHESVPGSVEAYYQEAGRAGRDGAPSRALLFAEGRDKGLHVFFIQRGEIADAEVARVARRIGAAAAETGRYDLELPSLVTGECSDDQVRAILGILARVGVVQPAPSAPDRVRGRLLQTFDARAKANARTLAGEAQRIRWQQYRSVWGFVESRSCRRRALLEHFGDTREPAPEVPCCDVCDASLRPAPPAPARRSSASGPAAASLDDAIVSVVSTADPSLGRTRVVEILRGSRSKKIVEHSYDGLPDYGAYAHLAQGEVMERVDHLLDSGRLRSTGGFRPTLEVA